MWCSQHSPAEHSIDNDKAANAERVHEVLCWRSDDWGKRIAKGSCNAIIEAGQKFGQRIDVAKSAWIGIENIQNGTTVPERDIKENNDTEKDEGHEHDAPEGRIVFMAFIFFSTMKVFSLLPCIYQYKWYQ